MIIAARSPFAAPRRLVRSRPARPRPADAAAHAFFPFESGRFAVKSQVIKNQTRGRKPCVNPFSLSPFFPCRLRAACKIQHRAASLALLQAPPSLMRWTKTWSQVRLWVALPGRPLVASKSACRPANRATNGLATDPFALTGHSHTTDGVARAYRPRGPVLHFASACGQSKGDICSRKS